MQAEKLQTAENQNEVMDVVGREAQKGTPISLIHICTNVPTESEASGYQGPERMITSGTIEHPSSTYKVEVSVAKKMLAQYVQSNDPNDLQALMDYVKTTPDILLGVTADYLQQIWTIRRPTLSETMYVNHFAPGTDIFSSQNWAKGKTDLAAILDPELYGQKLYEKLFGMINHVGLDPQFIQESMHNKLHKTTAGTTRIVNVQGSFISANENSKQEIAPEATIKTLIELLKTIRPDLVILARDYNTSPALVLEEVKQALTKALDLQG